MSIVLLVQPVTDAGGAVQPKTDKQAPSTATATATAKPDKKSIATATKTAQQQPARNKPLTGKASIAPSKVKAQQTAGNRTPAKRDAAAGDVQQARNDKQKTTVAIAAQSKTASAPSPKAIARSTKVRRPAAAPVVTHLPAGAVSEIDKQISSKSAIVMDAHTGEELFARSPDNPRQPASTIKIVTAMIALKSLKDDDVVDVSDHAAGMPSSKIFLEPSKHYRANDLINAVLLASANDASVALAEKIAGSEDNFANLMTLSARMWGARNTVCRTASGLTASGQQSTARDLATLFRYAMQHDEFAHRMHEKFISTSYGKVLRNHNKALWRLDGAVGGKTGYTVAARQTYVGQFSRDNQTIVVAIMGSETMWADLAKLVEYGFRKKKEEQLARIGSDTSRGRATRLN